MRITEALKKQVLSLWFSGATYREITEKTGVSSGSIGEILQTARATIPNLDDLRKNTVLVGRLSSEKGEDFVEAAKKLIVLEEQTGKPCEELLKDFEGLSAKIIELQEHVDQLNSEVKDLNKEKLVIKDTFSAQGLSFDEGLKLVTGIENLNAETKVWTNGLAAAKSDFEEEKKKIVRAKKELVRVENVGRRFQTSNEQLRINNKHLEMMNKDLEKKFKDNYESLQNGWQCKEKLESSIKKLTTEHNKLQEKKELLEPRLQELSTNIETAEKKKVSLEKECKTMIEKANKKRDEIDAAGLKKLKTVNEKAEEIIKSAEARENQILSGVTAKKEALQKNVKVLEAEKELLEVGITPLLDQIHAEQDKLRAEREKAHKDEKTPSENFLQRLPDFEV